MANYSMTGERFVEEFKPNGLRDTYYRERRGFVPKLPTNIELVSHTTRIRTTKKELHYPTRVVRITNCEGNISVRLEEVGEFSDQFDRTTGIPRAVERVEKMLEVKYGKNKEGG